MSETVTTEKFDPSKYLISLKGKEYLEVKWRLAWFRDENPNGTIDTELIFQGITHDNPMVIFKATVTNEQGGSASGFGSEDAADFGDFIEKAETKAIGRALAALGYGTQFCDDHEFTGDTGKPVDSPGGKRTARRQAPPRPNEDGTYSCEECGTQIKDSRNYSAAELASISMHQAGRVLCYTCRNK